MIDRHNTVGETDKGICSRLDVYFSLGNSNFLKCPFETELIPFFERNCFLSHDRVKTSVSSLNAKC